MLQAPRFPVANWDGTEVHFEPSSSLPASGIEAVVVFAFYQRRFLLACIDGRGWCVPSGHLEPGEGVVNAALREVFEETGAQMEFLLPLGLFHLKPPKEPDTLAPALYGVAGNLGSRPESESSDVRAVSRLDLPDIYYRWDPLLEAVFAWAEQQYLQFQSDT